MNTRTRKKHHIIKKYGHSCIYCGCNLDQTNFSLDHLIPVSKGGSNQKTNLRPSCQKCNALKNDMTPKEFYNYIKNVRYELMTHLSNQLKAMLKTREKLKIYQDMYVNTRENFNFAE